MKILDSYQDQQPTKETQKAASVTNKNLLSHGDFDPYSSNDNMRTMSGSKGDSGVLRDRLKSL